MSSAPTDDSVLASLGVAAAVGSQGTLLISCMHERFGHRNFGALAGIAGLSLLPASLCFATLLSGMMYDKAARAQVGAARDAVAPPGGWHCVGAACFRSFYLFMVCVALAEALVALLHYHRLRPFYVKLAAKRSAEKLS